MIQRSVRIEAAGAVVVVAACLLSACAAGTNTSPVKAYLGPERPPSEIAIVKMSAATSEFSGSFTEYGEGESKFGTTKVQGAGRELRLAPGRYTVRVHCTGATGHASPYLQVNVNAGTTYEVACARTGIDGRSVRAGVVAISDSQPPK